MILNRKNRAEGIERLLYACPACQSLGTLYSGNNHFTCRSCGLRVLVTDRGLFESEKLPEGITQERDWNVWQHRWLADHLLSLDAGDIIFPVGEIPVLHVFKQDLLEFYHGKTLYKAFFHTRTVSAYTWMQTFKLL